MITNETSPEEKIIADQPPSVHRQGGVDDFCTSWLNGSPDEGLEPVDPAPIVFIDVAGGWRGSYVEQPTAQRPMHFLLDANANIRFETVGSALPPNELRTQLDLLRAAPYEPAP